MSSMKALVVGSLLALAAGGALAADDDLVKFRQSNMSIIGGHMSSIVAIAKGEAPYKDQMAFHAQGLAAAAEHVKAVFKEKAESRKSEAKPEIWSKWDEFAKRADDFKAASDKLAKAATGSDQGAIRSAMGDVGKSCKGCHDNFKKD